ncbi:unnamed protein product [Sphagnum troendelagicum]|uniref:Microtubule-associated protein 70-2 n=1 Tax=Sphagnum troendelagicum TaxID=128251 RepID=A0ABP0U4F5_9BRYO
MEEPISTVVGYDDFSHDAGIRNHSSAASQVGNETPQLSCVTRAEGIKPNRKNSVRATVDTDDSFFNLLHGSDPIRMELTRLENLVKDKDRELVEAQAEVKALKLSERLKTKAVEELADQLEKVDEKLKSTEILLENKNLELKRINSEKKAAQSGQIAAEATLRRVHAAQKDEDLPPIEAILAPLEAELKLARHEIARLQENNRALERLTKSKEAALVEAERTVEVAEAKATTVDCLQNQNQELLRQIEIFQEENKFLDKMHRQKVAEVEKLSRTVVELEEAVVAGGGAVNAARDYQRQVHELLEGKKTLERELARAKVSANRVATVVANSWKDSQDKLMPVKQWLDERRFMQGEIQQLRDKLSAMEKSAKNELQLKDKLQLRLKVLEEGLEISSITGTPQRSSKKGPKSTVSASKSSLGCQSNGSEESIVTDGSRNQLSAGLQSDNLQKEVILVKKASHEEDQNLEDKHGRVEMLSETVELLSKSKEVDAMKVCKEVTATEKEVAAMRVDRDQHQKSSKLLSMSKGRVNSSQPLSARNLRSPKEERAKNQTGSGHFRSHSPRSHISGCRIVPVSVPGLITNFVPASFDIGKQHGLGRSTAAT